MNKIKVYNISVLCDGRTYYPKEFEFEVEENISNKKLKDIIEDKIYDYKEYDLIIYYSYKYI